jgi:hypothetical protein
MMPMMLTCVGGYQSKTVGREAIFAYFCPIQKLMDIKFITKSPNKQKSWYENCAGRNTFPQGKNSPIKAVQNKSGGAGRFKMC